MRLGLQIPHDRKNHELLKALGLSCIQLRIGPGFPIETADPNLEEARRTADAFKAEGIQVLAMGFYRNMLATDDTLREDETARLRNVMRMAPLFGTDIIGVFAGRDPDKSIEDNIPAFVNIWKPLAQEAEDLGVKLAFENCTMFRGYPIRGINMSHTPHSYDLMFEALDSPALGIEFDSSHLMKQFLDPAKFLRRFPDRIFHMHAKDHEVLPEQLELHGRFDVRASRDRYPGRGQTDFAGIFQALAEIGYCGDVSIEGERDPDANTEEEIVAGLRASVQMLRQFIPADG
ncbi:sugar phosphate isomerase/epimerase [bacterium]|nr:sugar phosphate isomerase/epimerase [bacterium]